MERVTKNLDFQWDSVFVEVKGVKQAIISNTLDENAKKGQRTRIVKYDPNARAGVFVHDYEEEVFVISGSQKQIFPSSECVVYQAGDFIERKAGTPHGPFESDSGCVLLEIHYYK